MVVAPRPVAPRQVTVREYSYDMNGIHTGTLFLLDSPYHPRLVSWLSHRTQLKTAWHGSWTTLSDPEEHLVINFDFEGRERYTGFKWTRVHGLLLGPGQLAGQDYLLRAISMRLTQVWQLNDESVAFLIGRR